MDVIPKCCEVVEREREAVIEKIDEKQWGIHSGDGYHCGGDHNREIANLGFMPTAEDCESACTKTPGCEAYETKNRQRDGSYECVVYTGDAVAPIRYKDKEKKGDCVWSCDEYYKAQITDRNEWLLAKRKCPPQQIGEPCRVDGDCGATLYNSKRRCEGGDFTKVGHCVGVVEPKIDAIIGKSSSKYQRKTLKEEDIQRWPHDYKELSNCTIS